MKYILGLGLPLWLSLWGGSGVPWVAGGRLLWLVLLSCRVPCLLSAFLLCLWCITLEYSFISRFGGVFGGFWGADVYLYGLRSLR